MKVTDILQSGALLNIKEDDIFELIPGLEQQLEERSEEASVIKQTLFQWFLKESIGGQYHSARVCCLPSAANKVVTNIRDRMIDDYCEYYKLCPLYKFGLTVQGEPCPLELTKISQWTQELVDDLEIEIKENFTDKHILEELIKVNLIEYRAHKALSATSLNQTNISEGKTESVTHEVSRYLKIIESTQRMKHSLRKDLVATRDAKAKYQKEKKKDKEVGKQMLLERLKKDEKENVLGLIIDDLEDFSGIEDYEE